MSHRDGLIDVLSPQVVHESVGTDEAGMTVDSSGSSRFSTAESIRLFVYRLIPISTSQAPNRISNVAGHSAALPGQRDTGEFLFGFEFTDG